MKWLIYLIIGIGMIGMVNAMSIQGTCTLTNICNITTANYTASLQGCTIIKLVWNGVNFNWAQGEIGGTTAALGQLWTTGQLLYPGLTNSRATVTNDETHIRINCTNNGATAFNDWYFEETYINLTQNATANFQTYNYFNTSENIFGWNTTINITAASLTNIVSGGGVVGVSYPSLAGINMTILAMAYDESKTTSTGYRTAAGTPPGIGIGRGSQVTANNKFNVIYKVLPINSSESGYTAKYTDVLKAFKLNPSYGDPVIGSDPCVWSGSGDFNITNQVCNVTSNYNLLGNNAYWSNVTMINNGSISNYTVWWESGTIIDI